MILELADIRILPGQRAGFEETIARAPSTVAIAFITHSADIRRILDPIEVAAQPPRIAPARGPPLWRDCDAQKGDGVRVEPDWDLAAQPAADYEVDQRMHF